MLGLTIFFFILLNAAPGGPCEHYKTSTNPELVNRYQPCRILHGLDKPLPVQYLRWLQLTAHGDLGFDVHNNPVIGVIVQKLPATLILVIVSYIFQELLALPLGILGALKRHSFFDVAFTVLSYIGLSMPTFWLGLMLIIAFSVMLPWFPPSGIMTIPNPALLTEFGTPAYWAYASSQPLPALSDFIQHLILPGLTLAIVGIAIDSRFMRASLLDVINQDYVRTARAKGLPPRTVIVKHELRNALLPIITNVGSVFIPSLVAGAIVTETIFNWPGMGQLFTQSVGEGDNTMLQAILLLSALFVLIGNLIADIAYAWADPRIRYR